MPVDDKTLQQTVGEVIGETIKSNSNNNSTETEKGISDGISDDTKSGDTSEKIYASGVDISDIPEQDRTRITELLTKKASLLEKGYQDKFKEVSTLKKAQSELASAGLTVEEAQSVLQEHIRKKQSPQAINSITQDKKDASSLIDNLIEQSPENRASLEQLRTVILQVTNSSVLNDKIAKMEQLLGGMAGTVLDTKKAKLNTELDGLSDKYGKEFIESKREDILDKALRFNASPKKILFADYPDEVEQAISVKGNRKPLTPEKRNAIMGNGQTVSSANEKIDIKKESMGNIISQLLKKK